MTEIDLDHLARQQERILAEIGRIRAEMRGLHAALLRLDSSVQAMVQELGAISGLLAERSPPPAVAAKLENRRVTNPGRGTFRQGTSV
jgi:hypothetical protein